MHTSPAVFPLTMNEVPNQTLQATAVKCLGWHVGRHRPAVPELGRSAGAGVKGVVVVDFRNGMIDGVLKQHC